MKTPNNTNTNKSRLSRSKPYALAWSVLAGLVSSCHVYAIPNPLAKHPYELDSMVAFIATKPLIMGGLEQIDFKKREVHYRLTDDDGEVTQCVAAFGKHSLKLFGFGPKNGLVFKHANCDID